MLKKTIDEKDHPFLAQWYEKITSEAVMTLITTMFKKRLAEIKEQVKAGELKISQLK